MSPVRKWDIDTPALLIDFDLLEKNIDTMARFFRGQDCELRPHVKTHKCPTIAHMQLAAGARGITCAKLGEAEVMAQAGIKDILIANQVVGERKIARLVGLARYSDIIVAVDDVENVRQLSVAATAAGVTIGVLIEVEVGMNRCGVVPGPRLLEMARLIRRCGNLRFRGVMGYEGHAVFIENESERRRVAGRSHQALLGAASMLRKVGFEVEIVSAAGTGTYRFAATCPGITEVQAGSYVFNDVRYHALVPEFERSLAVLCTVVSRPVPERVITDGGLKVFSSGWGPPEVKGRADLKVLRLAEEHGICQVQGPAPDLRPGAKVEMYVSHCCTAVNLHDRYYVVRGDSVVAEWPILARGKSQ